MNLPTSALPMVKFGKTAALAVTSGTREKELPNVPTLHEAGCAITKP